MKRRWLQWLVGTVTVVVLLLAFGGWLRGQDQWGPFRGRLVDAETGAPIANANVIVSWRKPRFNLADTIFDFYDAREAVTDAQGWFAIHRLWRLWTVDVTKPGFDYFVPGYVASIQDITPQNGVTHVDPTVIKVRRQIPSRCYDVRRPSVTIPEEKIPNVIRALRKVTEECLAKERSRQ